MKTNAIEQFRVKQATKLDMLFMDWLRYHIKDVPNLVAGAVSIKWLEKHGYDIKGYTEADNPQETYYHLTKDGKVIDILVIQRTEPKLTETENGYKVESGYKYLTTSNFADGHDINSSLNEIE